MPATIYSNLFVVSFLIFTYLAEGGRYWCEEGRAFTDIDGKCLTLGGIPVSYIKIAMDRTLLFPFDM